MSQYLYEVLGVDPTASEADIKTAYRKAARENHPDKTMHDGEDTTARFQEIQRAYSILSNPASRKKYDAGEDPEITITEEKKIEDAAIGAVLQLFDQLFEKQDDRFFLHHDLIEHMRNHLSQASGNIKQNKKQIWRMLKRLRLVRHRITSTDFMIIEHMRTKRRRLIASMKEQKFNQRVANKIMELLENMEYEYDAAPPQPSWAKVSFTSS